MREYTCMRGVCSVVLLSPACRPTRAPAGGPRSTVPPTQPVPAVLEATAEPATAAGNSTPRTRRTCVRAIPLADAADAVGVAAAQTAVRMAPHPRVVHA